MYNAEQGLERKGGREKMICTKRKYKDSKNRQHRPENVTQVQYIDMKEKMYKKGMYKYKKVGKNEIFVAFVVLGFERRR